MNARIAKLSGLVAMAAVVAACGGSSDSGVTPFPPVSPAPPVSPPAEFPRAVSHLSLTSEADAYSVLPFVDTDQARLTVSLNRVVQTEAEFQPLTRSANIVFAGVNPRPAPLSDPATFFANRSLVAVNAGGRNEMERYRLLSVVENQASIVAQFEICTTDRFGGVGSELVPVQLVFSIPKTSKPVVIPPVQRSPLPPYPAGVGFTSLGRCPEV